MQKNTVEAINRREELRREFRSYRLTRFSELDVLEFLLTFSVQTGETRSLATKIMCAFGGTLYNVICASYAELMAVDGVTKQTACLLSMLKFFFRKYTLAHYPAHVKLLDKASAADYLKNYFLYEPKEKIIIAALDKCGDLIGVKEFSISEISSVAIHLPTIAEYLLNVKAYSFIAAHNHPNGNVTPSPEDIFASTNLHNNMRALGIHQHQNYIFFQSDWFALVDDKEL